MKNYHTIVFTGWPCSGKTTAIEFIQKKFEARGYTILYLLEPATQFLATMGIEMGEWKLSPVEFQWELVKYQNEAEKMILRIAKKYEGTTLVLLDRTLLDWAAYLDQENFEVILAENNISKQSLFDTGRYDYIIHMNTAAKWAEEFYTLKNNEARKESIKEARVLDDAMLEIYWGHPNLTVIDNSSDFAGKLKRVEETLITCILEK